MTDQAATPASVEPVPTSHDGDLGYVRQLLAYLAGEWPLVVIAVVAMLLGHGLLLLTIEVPREVLQLLDSGRTPPLVAWSVPEATTRSAVVAWSATWWLSALAGFYASFFVYQYTVNLISERVVRRLRREAFSRVMSLPLIRLNSTDLGPVVSRLVVNTDAVPGFVNQVLFRRVSDLVLLAAMCVYLGLQSALLLGIACLGFPLLGLAAVAVSRRTRTLSERLADAREGVTADIRETLAASREIRLNAAEDRERAEFADVLDRYYDSARWHHRFIWATEATLTALIEVVPIVVFSAGCYLTVTRGLTVATLVTFLMALPRMTLPFTRLLLTVEPYQQTIVPLRRLLDVVNWQASDDAIEGQRRPPDLTTRAAPLLCVREAAYTYRSGGHHVAFPDLELGPGRVLGLIGESGTGKSTLLHVLAKILGGYTGSIRLAGEELRELHPAAVRELVGIMGQEPFFFNRSLRENVAYGTNRGDVTLAEVQRACRLACIHDDVGTILGGYDALVRNQGENLSGGQKRRLALARALVNDPRILLLDEPFTGIPPDQVHAILQTIKGLADGRLIIMVTHELEVARQLDELLVFRHRTDAAGCSRASVVARGTPAELHATSPDFRALEGAE